MVRGLDHFKTWFADYQDKYILIGGTAASLVMEDVGLPFRITKDLDLLLTVESLSPKFAAAFWAFIDAGGYKHQQKSTGKDIFYRFTTPSDTAFPAMIELFSRAPEGITPRHGAYLTPIPISEEAASLSAILLDTAYYEFIINGRLSLDGISIVGADRLIPLKAKAWLDLMSRKQAGMSIDEKDIVKHQNDIFRLSQILDPEKPIMLPPSIADSMRRALDELAKLTNLNLRDFGIRQVSLHQIIDLLHRQFLGGGTKRS